MLYWRRLGFGAARKLKRRKEENEANFPRVKHKLISAIVNKLIDTKKRPSEWRRCGRRSGNQGKGQLAKQCSRQADDHRLRLLTVEVEDDWGATYEGKGRVSRRGEHQRRRGRRWGSTGDQWWECFASNLLQKVTSLNARQCKAVSCNICACAQTLVRLVNDSTIIGSPYHHWWRGTCEQRETSSKECNNSAVNKYSKQHNTILFSIFCYKILKTLTVYNRFNRSICQFNGQ